MDPLSYKRPRSTSKYHSLIKKFFPHKNFQIPSYIKIFFCLPYMKKNSDKNFENLRVDPITGEYFLVIPEWIVNELSWYEDTEIEVNLEGNEIILSEKD